MQACNIEITMFSPHIAMAILKCEPQDIDMGRNVAQTNLTSNTIRCMRLIKRSLDK